MKLETTCLDERCLNIYEYDYVNNQKILILKVYCTKRDEGVWEFPQPQIFNQQAYETNKKNYDDAILSFRQDCENLTEGVSTTLQNQITGLNADVDNLEEVSLDTDYQLLNLKIELDLIS